MKGHSDGILRDLYPPGRFGRRGALEDGAMRRDGRAAQLTILILSPDRTRLYAVSSDPVKVEAAFYPGDIRRAQRRTRAAPSLRYRRGGAVPPVP